MRQGSIGTAVETQGGRTDCAYGLSNTTRTAAQENAAVTAAINARAGSAEKAAALNEFNEMLKENSRSQVMSKAATLERSPMKPPTPKRATPELQGSPSLD